MLIQRKLAQVIWGGNGGKPDAFDKFWPIENIAEPDKKVWGITEQDAKETQEEIMKSHNIVLK